MWIFLPASPYLEVRNFSIAVWQSSSDCSMMNFPDLASERISRKPATNFSSSSPFNTPIFFSICACAIEAWQS